MTEFLYRNKIYLLSARNIILRGHFATGEPITRVFLNYQFRFTESGNPELRLTDGQFAHRVRQTDGCGGVLVGGQGIQVTNRTAGGAT